MYSFLAFYKSLSLPSVTAVWLFDSHYRTIRSVLPAAKSYIYNLTCYVHIQRIIIVTHNYPTGPWAAIHMGPDQAAVELRRTMCASVCVLVCMPCACVYGFVNVCRAAAVFVLCNPEHPICSGSMTQADGCQSRTSLLNITQ